MAGHQEASSMLLRAPVLMCSMETFMNFYETVPWTLEIILTALQSLLLSAINLVHLVGAQFEKIGHSFSVTTRACAKIWGSQMSTPYHHWMPVTELSTILMGLRPASQ